jgi:hypothetical protein
MKKLLLLLSCVVGYTIVSAQSYSSSPAVGCPNATHDLTFTITNGGTAVPSSMMYTVTLNVKTNVPTTLKTFTQNYNDGFAANETKSFVIEDVPFEGPMTCTVDGNISWVMMMMGPPPNFTQMPMVMYIYIPAQDYTVAYPPTLTITETAGEINNSTSLNGYSVRYYLNGDYNTYVEQSTTGNNFTPANNGSYTAKAYDLISSCVSEDPSNAIMITTTAVKGSTKTNEVSVYPNPVVSSVTIETEISSPLSYVLSDLNGTVVRNASFERTGQVNMEELKSGAYILTIKNEKENIASYKLTK